MIERNPALCWKSTSPDVARSGFATWCATTTEPLPPTDILLKGVASRIREITEFAQVSVLTADTFGTVRAECDGLPVDVRVFARDDASACKASIVRELGAEGCVCIGNGFNDITMFSEAALSIAIMGKEGACESF